MFLLPSAWGEAFPLAVCEAMACGVPSVVTDVGDTGLRYRVAEIPWRTVCLVFWLLLATPMPWRM
ncbi:glycosyltransferase (plasmid) [Ruegeria sp. B32]|nr:glycosyltransferase [Ruegeria sp. B32]